MSSRLLILSGLLVLSAAVCFQLWVGPHYAATDRASKPHLHRVLNGAAAGWTAQEQPLGPTEASSGDAQRILNFDDCVSRVYTRNSDRFSIFVAYWAPNKMPTNVVASHTPDRCWIAAGWACDEYALRESLQVGKTHLQPAYWRLFRANSQKQYVLYWHLVGGRVQIYRGNDWNRVIDWRYWWKQAINFGLRGNEEQYFVRVTSDGPFEQIWDDPGFQDVMQRLTALGLARR